ncbi:MAG: type II secretion system F family protein [Candidatus Dependentiae bacterium]
MALYYYQAFSKDGKKITGYVDAGSEVSVKEQLQRKGIFPTKVERSLGGKKKSWYARFFEKGVSVKEVILFTKQLAVLLKSGVPLLQAFELLSEQFSGRLQTVIVAIKDDLKEGRALADAMSDYPKIFSNIYVQLVRAGEASGKLEMILERLDGFLERREQIRKQVKSAMMMPIIQMVVAVIVVGVMMIFVVPQMAQNFATQNKELPLPTRVIINLSEILQSYWIFLILLGALLVMGYMYWAATKEGRRFIDRAKLKMPLIKYFAKTNAVVQFSSTLGMLIESGVNLAESLDIVVSIINNSVLANALDDARDNIIKQGKIAQYLKKTDIFPPIAIYLIKTGEESGNLDMMLLTVARNYEEDLAELTDSMTATLGPILLVVMALVVGFIVIAIAVPMMDFGEISGI